MSLPIFKRRLWTKLIRMSKKKRKRRIAKSKLVRFTKLSKPLLKSSPLKRTIRRKLMLPLRSKRHLRKLKKMLKKLPLRLLRKKLSKVL